MRMEDLRVAADAYRNLMELSSRPRFTRSLEGRQSADALDRALTALEQLLHTPEGALLILEQTRSVPAALAAINYLADPLWSAFVDVKMLIPDNPLDRIGNPEVRAAVIELYGGRYA